MNIRYAKRRDVIRIEEISHLNGGDSLLEWCLAYEDLDFVRDYTRMVGQSLSRFPVKLILGIDSLGRSTTISSAVLSILPLLPR